MELVCADTIEITFMHMSAIKHGWAHAHTHTHAHMIVVGVTHENKTNKYMHPAPGLNFASAGQIDTDMHAYIHTYRDT